MSGAPRSWPLAVRVVLACVLAVLIALIAVLPLALVLVVLSAPAEAAAAIPIVISSAVSAGVTSVLGAFGATIFGKVVAGLAGFAVSSLFSSLVGKESTPQQESYGGFTREVTGRQQVVRSNIEVRRLVYGEVMTSGPLVFAGASGASNDTLDLVIVLAPHRVHAIGQVFLNDEAIGDLDGNGNVTTGRFAGYVQVTKVLGNQTAADAGLMARHPSKWTAAHVGYGCAYIIVTLTYSRDVFPNGIPNVKAIVQGRLVWDPRTAQFGYSNNWALVVRDYLTTSFADGGLAATSDEIDDTAIIAAANVCDERVDMAAYEATATADAATDLLTYTVDEPRIATGDAVTVSTDGMLPAPLAILTTYYAIRVTARTVRLATTYANAIAGTAIDLTASGNGTHRLAHVSQARYTFNGTVDLSRRPLDVLRALMTAAAGVLTYPQGKFTLCAGAYTVPVETFTPSHLRGEVDLLAAPPRRELFNAVRGTFTDPAQQWQPADFPPVRNAVYVTQDGNEEVFRDIELPYTTDVVRAQRIAKIHLEQSRQGITVVLPMTYAAFSVALWETVMLTYAAFGWSGKVFRVTGWRLADDGLGVDLTLREEASAAYDWAAGEATVRDPAPDTNLPSPFAVAAPGAPAVTEELYETTGSAGVKARALMTWTAVPDPFVVRYEAQFKTDNDPQDAWAALASVSLTSARVEDVTPGTYDFRVRAINGIGVRSDWSPTTTVEVRGLTAPPADVSGLSVIASAGFALASWTRSADLDVRIGGQVVIRHSPMTSGAAWENGVILETFAGDSATGLVPLITGTYMAKFVDSAGAYSAAAASFVATEGMVTGLSTLATITESTTFPGTKTNVVVASSTLKLDTTVLIDSVADFDAIADLDALGTISPTGTYLFNTVYDGTTKAVRRYEADIAVTASDTGDLIDARGDVDDWDSVDGATINDCDVTLYAALTDDNPAGSPTWGPWVPFMVSDFNARAAKFKLEFESGSPNHNIAVSTLAVAVKA